MRIDDIKYAAHEHGWEFITLQDKPKMISFKKSGVRINIYHTTSTVATCLDHPVHGKTQLFRRNVSPKLLDKIFKNPRIHTNGKGYKITRAKYKKKSYANSTVPQNNLKTALLRKIPNPRAGDPYDAGLFRNRKKSGGKCDQETGGVSSPSQPSINGPVQSIRDKEVVDGRRWYEAGDRCPQR